MNNLAVVVTTYNCPQALRVVGEGFLAQTDRRFELIVADDGSTGETTRVIETLARTADFPVQHVWQEDRGFRAATVRNRAVAATSAEYLVFTDGDCVPLPGFIAGHRRLAERRWFLSGNRVLLGRALTVRIVAEEAAPFRATPLQAVGHRLWGGMNRLLPLVRLPLPNRLRKRAPGRWQGVRTANFSLWREDFLAVDGFDESYTGWGLEDTDLVLRLLRAGVRHKDARFAGAAVLHLWHAEASRAELEKNRQRLGALRGSQRTRAARGLSRHMGPPDARARTARAHAL